MITHPDELPPDEQEAKRLVLIVDDNADNLQVLAGHLTEAGYEVLAANNGPRALALVGNRKPDLILLDIQMPGMDGFAVCRKLKADPDMADIPVIFITAARTDTNDVLEGFELGAVDYVTKPFKSLELLARVRTHVDLKLARDLILEYNRRLRNLSAHLQKTNTAKNRFLGIVSHDIRGAFSNVISVSRMLTDGEPMDAAQAARFLSDIGIEAEHMMTLSENLLNLEVIEQQDVCPASERVETKALLDFVFQSHQLAAKAKRIRVLLESDDAPVRGDLTSCRQVLTNLVSNAVKYSPAGSTIWVTARRDEADGSVVRLAVRDQGPGLSDDDQKKLFTPYTRLTSKTTASEHSVGLGLSIVKLMTEAMSGRVICESRLGEGAVFAAVLPAWTE
ncbi:MAG: hybrid sensor histidine kinase/response regulator [Opitutaceae bacterium]|nr:hybrid sensor histidine kinase/response regulator [Opitutaceae bacterium]